MSRRIYWLKGDQTLGIRSALVLRNEAGMAVLRFGKDDGWSAFSERYQGQFGIPKRYWYGPFGLTFIIRPNEHTNRKVNHG